MRLSWLFLLALLASTALLPVRAEEETIELEEEAEDDVEDDEPTEAAFLLVRRHISEKMPLEGKPIEVIIELYNAGSSAATHVEVNDTRMPDMIWETEGETTAAFDNIPAGATLSFRYTITPKSAGPTSLQQVTVKYRPIPGDGKEQYTAVPPTTFYVLTFGIYSQIKALEYGKKLSLGYLTTTAEWLRFIYVFGGSLAIFFGLKIYRGVKETSQKRRREKALADLQKMQ